MDDIEVASLQAMVEYYRNKSYKLEHEFLLYKLQSESLIRDLRLQLSANADEQEKTKNRNTA